MGLFGTLKDLLLGGRVDYKGLVENGALIVDVRTPQEYKSGHVKGSINIPLQTLLSNLKKVKNKEVILVCRSGARAAQAKSMLTSKGITAYNAGPWQTLRNL
ncbi:rhodanese-like domain-containing protein [bacterium SCSIO 12741]|nr:rhodanese-like domain-containing protein [bacterium SCSIO 12741]